MVSASANHCTPFCQIFAFPIKVAARYCFHVLSYRLVASGARFLGLCNMSGAA